MATTPTEFSQLRIRARIRRDEIIEQARAEYEETLRQIATLEQRIQGRPRPDKMPTTAAIESVIPIDQPFTTSDIMNSLEALDPSRVWPLASVTRHVVKLRGLSLIRRLKRHLPHEPAVYIRTDKAMPPVLTDRTLQDVLPEIVTKPMRTAEVCHALKEAGWQTRMIPAHFRTFVINRLKRAGFKERDGKWWRTTG